MSQSTAVATRKAASRKWPRWIVISAWTTLGLLTSAALIAFLTVQFGAVYGVEFNPYSFARRSYSLYEIPLIRVQVRGLRREDVPSLAVDFLDQQKYVAASTGAPNVWHVVTATRGVRMPKIGDADILIRYLDSKDQGDYHVWVAWSEKHPELAKVFWPAVGLLAQEELYVFIPDLFELARGTADPGQFQKQLHRHVAERLFEVARRMQEDDEHAEAKRLLDEAVKLNPSDPLLKRAREISAAKAPEKRTAPPQK